MRYRQCLDEKDFSGYAALFAEEGEFVAAGGTAKGARGGSRSFVDGMRGDLLTAVVGDDLHIVVNPEISVDGDRATARSTWIYLVRGDDGEPKLCKVGHYEDELVREQGTAFRAAIRAHGHAGGMTRFAVRGHRAPPGSAGRRARRVKEPTASLPDAAAAGRLGRRAAPGRAASRQRRWSSQSLAAIIYLLTR